MTGDVFIRRVAAGLAGCCLALLIGTAAVVAVPSLRERFSAAPVAAYQVGQSIDVPAALYRSSRRTVFVFSRADCAACQRSKLSTAELVATLRRQPAVQAVMVVGEGKAEAELRFAADLGLDEGHVAQIDLSALRLQHVPTFLLTDESGKILHVIDGVLTEEGRQSLLRAATADSSPALAN